jgi:hypothetical protein
MALEQIVTAHYRRSALTTAQVVAAVLAIWRATGPSGFRDELVRAAGLVAFGQLTQAIRAAAYLSDLADEYDWDRAPVQIVPRAFAGTSADDRPLVDVLSYATRRAWTMLDAGADYATANTSATATLTRIVANETTQAGINAERVGMVAQPQATGYVRFLSPPSCGRCAVLAGKWFEWNTGFARHPGCDCKHVVAADAAGVTDVRVNPRDYFDALSPVEQDHYFGPDEAAAIRGGADLQTAVNASTRKGSRSGLTVPRSIDRLVAGKSRDEATDILTRTGYLAA